MTEILAIDLGTSRIKCAFFDENGAMTGLADRRLERTASPDRQDAEVWYTSVAALLSKALQNHAPDAVALTGNMHALLGLGPDGRPVAPAVLWSDSSAGAEAQALNQRYGDALIQRYGNVAIPVFTLPKILHYQDLCSKANIFLQSKDYLGYRLTGNLVTDPTDSSGVLGMRLSDYQWDAKFLQDLGLSPKQFPEIQPSTAFRGTVTAQAARDTGLAQGTPVLVGCGDLASAALGSGTDAQTLSLTLGTAGQLLAVGSRSTGAALGGKLFIFADSDPERELYLGSVPAGGFALEWLARTMRLSMPEFFAAAENVPITADLPVFLPYLLGRGAPYMDYTPCGGWRGLSAHHTPALLCRAAIAGVLSPLRQCADLLEHVNGKRESIVLQALAAREKAVQETAAALFPQPNKLLPVCPEASLLGAAILGMTAVHVYDSIPLAARAMVHTIPAPIIRPETIAAANAYYRRFREAAG